MSGVVAVYYPGERAFGQANFNISPYNMINILSFTITIAIVLHVDCILFKLLAIERVKFLHSVLYVLCQLN